MAETGKPADGFKRGVLFWIGVLALFTAAMANALRVATSGAIQHGVFDPIDAAHSGQMIGGALGAAFGGFALSLLVVSPLLDIVGVKRVLIVASLAYVAGSILIIAAPSLGGDVPTLITAGMALTGIGWGCTEGSINPMTAALYPEDKTHRLNVLHAWWPAGLVVGGLLGVFLNAQNTDWRIEIALIIIPGALLGVWAATQQFPKTESAALGVSFNAMLMEPFKHPTFWIFFGIMFLTASTELAPGAWVDVALTHVVGMQGVLLLVYVSALMFVMRHFAGALAHRISDMGLLWFCTLPAAGGLYLLSVANSPTTAIIGATVWAFGVCFMWPTMLAAVSHRYPRGGSWTIGLTGVAGAGAIQFVLPKLGAIYDQAKAANGGSEVAAAAQSFQSVALIPCVLFVIFGIVWLAERRKKFGDATAASVAAE
ncbi:MAG TPA: MFS transporter [Caulobacterales bacterium]|nr:MFS transporter [Caulobacterales bacterium]